MEPFLDLSIILHEKNLYCFLYLASRVSLEMYLMVETTLSMTSVVFVSRFYLVPSLTPPPPPMGNEGLNSRIKN